MVTTAKRNLGRWCGPDAASWLGTACGWCGGRPVVPPPDRDWRPHLTLRDGFRSAVAAPPPTALVANHHGHYVLIVKANQPTLHAGRALVGSVPAVGRGASRVGRLR